MNDTLAALEATLLAAKNNVTGGLPVQKSSTLLIYPGGDSVLEAALGAYATYSLGGADAVAVNSWNELRAALSARSSMTYEQIVISLHGADGQMQAGQEVKTLREILNDWKARSVKLPKVKDLIAIESCRAGGKVDDFSDFGRAFGARQVSGWSKYHAWGVRRFPMPNIADTAKRKGEFLKKASIYQPYLLPDAPRLDQLFGECKPGKTCTIYHEWFTDDDSDQPLSEVAETTDPHFLDRKYIPRSNAKKMTIDTLNDMNSWADIIEQSPTGAPLYQVFVNVHSA